MITTFVLMFIRHALTTGGGVLAAKGVIAASEVEAVVGAGTVIAGVIMSAWDKWKRRE